VIFVTVGNANQPFRRLLEAVDALAGEGAFGDEPVLMQTGHEGAFRARDAEEKPFLPFQDFDQCLRRASVVICHGGCTVFQALRAGKFPVVMPRLSRHGEHVNDHQLQFVRALAEAGYVIPAYEPADLMPAIERARRESGRPLPPSEMLSKVAAAVVALFPSSKG
jgi:UDP-N-acetylglucosamine transferase subunit ALG13